MEIPQEGYSEKEFAEIVRDFIFSEYGRAFLGASRFTSKEVWEAYSTGSDGPALEFARFEVGLKELANEGFVGFDKESDMFYIKESA